jgi:polysaccharide export outer membrane protein
MLHRFCLPLGLLFALTLSACSLPRGGPIQTEVVGRGISPEGNFSVVEISQENIDRLVQWPGTKGAQGWPSAAKGGVSNRIKAGDRVTLTIWENDDNALLTPNAQKSVALSEMVVSPSGSIFLPYIGDFVIRNQTPDTARAALQSKMSGILTSPQVQLSVNPGRQNTVDLVGGVAQAGSYPLADQNVSVLSLISLGGGIRSGLRNPQVRLVRGSNIYALSAETLMADPRRDAVLQGGDKLIVEEDKRYFLAVGASNTQSQIYFPQDRVTALDAMALIGGVESGRANPAAILILRSYDAADLRVDGSGPDKTRMIFTLDLTSADGLFSAQQFQVRPNDLVMVAESPVNGLRTLLSMVGQTVGLGRSLR